MQYLKADTNTEVLIGPAVAVGDGFTPVTTLSLSTADEAEIIKYGGATPLTVTSISANGFAAITSADGYYTLDITTGNSDTEGFLTVLINDDSLILPIRVDFMVVNANVYDSLFAAATTDYLQTDVTQWLGTAAVTPTTAGVPSVALTAIGLDAILATATGAVEIAKAIWDRVLSKANHNIAQSAGKRLRGIDAAFEVHSGTAQAGTAGTITLDTGASATDDIYRGNRIVIVAGTGAQEHGICTAYNGTTKVATMAENWVITPDATSDFEIVPADVDVETWAHNVVTAADVAIESTAQLVDDIWDETYTGHTTNQTFGKILKGISEGWISAEGSVNDASATTTSFITDLTSARDNFYDDAVLVFITEAVADTVKGVSRPITSYTASTKVVTFDEALPAAPADTDQFIVLNGHTHSVSEIVAGVVADPVIAELTTQGDTNEALLNDIPTVAEFEARTPTAAQLAYIAANAATGLAVTFTTAGGSTTAAVLNQVDGAAASSTNDQYNGRLLVFTDGTLKGVVTDITDYVGGTTTATITAIPTAPTSSHNARLI